MREIVDQLDINSEEMLSKIDKVAQAKDKLNEQLARTQEKSRDTWLLAVNVVSSTFNALDYLLQASGIQVSHIVRATVKSTISLAHMLIPILSAKAALSPWDKIQASIGIGNAIIAIAAAYEADRKANENAAQLNDLRRGLANIANILGIVYWR